MNKNITPLYIKQKLLLTNIFYGIANLILFSFFASLFFLCNKNMQDIIIPHYLHIIAYILFFSGFLFTT